MSEVYQFADQHEVTAIGGFSSSVAWHGRWLLGKFFDLSPLLFTLETRTGWRAQSFDSGVWPRS